MPTDRYADAVLDRRRELREQLDLLTGRPQLRDALALARAATTAELISALAELRREIDAQPTRPDLWKQAAAAARAVAEHAHREWGVQARGAARRVAADHGLPLPARWPAVPPAPSPPPDPAGPRPVGFGDVAADAGAWRLAVLPLVVAPLTGLAGPAVALPAVGAAIMILAVAVRVRRAAVERERMRQWAAELLGDTRARVDVEVVARTGVLVADSQLDRALARRRAVLEAELARLAHRDA